MQFTFIEYVDMQNKYVDMHYCYVNMQHNYFGLQENLIGKKSQKKSQTLLTFDFQHSRDYLCMLTYNLI